MTNCRNSRVEGPCAQVTVGATEITLLGTAHVSRASAEQVGRLIEEGGFHAVAVELCASRYQALINPDQLARMDLGQVIRQGKAAMVAASLAMAAYQKRIAEQFGIEPGAEQRRAIELAKQHGLELLLIDRDIGITLKRTAASLSWWKRWTLFTGLLVSLLSREEVEEEEIERLKEGDILETAFAEFAQDRQDLYRPLIEERDSYMAARLLQAANKRNRKEILAVIGAGHLKGVRANLEQGMDDPGSRIAELERVPPPTPWPKRIAWLVVALVVAGFAVGFQRSPQLGWSLVGSWVLINGSLSALGALLALGHPLTVVTAFLAAPVTSLNPTIGAGMVTAAAELWLRKPRVRDFHRLREETTHWSGWWKNRVSRTLLVFLFSTLGSAVGTYVAGFLIAGKLAGG